MGVTMKHPLVKWSSRLGLTVLAVGLAAGCGSKAPEQNGSTGAAAGDGKFTNKQLKVAVFEGGYGKAYWEEVVKKFEADYPGVKVEMTSNPKIMDVVKPQLVAGNPPDVIYAPESEPSGTVRSLISDKAIMDLTDVFESKALDKDVPLKDVITDGLLEYTKPYGDGKIYYAPLYVTTQGMWYNKTLFEQKGWKVPETWDEFLALGETAKKEGRSLYAYQGTSPGYNESILWPAIASVSGMEQIDKITNYEEGSFKNENVRKVLNIFEQISQKGYLMPGTVALNHTQAQTEFLKGKALFITNGNWFEGEMKDAPREEGFQYGFMAPPVFAKGEQKYTMTGFESMYIPKKSKNPDLAKEFIKYMYKEDNVKLNSEKSTGIVAVKNGAEYAKEFVPKSVYDSVKIFDQGVKPLNFQWKVTPKTEVKIQEEVFQPISSVMNKNMTVDQWVERVEKAFGKLRDVLAKSGQ
ncbi:carbohydrate ABC transporter, N-acetylglucosamine/diacetylchitobiose-binding protein [Paenibacillus sp. J31TS4]|nr:carbohydrate ABC transporter, N-acetylglucosamine/diacetylchitobiose-binding protein [Paenibacillus sp. J31TS4]